jgi:SnoaL-like domain
MSTSRSLARVQIQHTMAVYCNSVDSGDADGVAGAFMPEARLELSSGNRTAGRDAIKAFYQAVIGAGRPDRLPDGSIPLLRHNLTTSRVEFIDDDRAQGWTYFMAMTRFGLDHAGRYIDTFCREGERWLIEDRRIVVEWYASPSWYEQVRLKAAKS